jgi:hypothetical protein
VKHIPVLTLFALVSACAASVAQSPGAAPAPAPAPPGESPAGDGHGTLELAPGLSELSLSCRSAELPRANALDDDCDGTIDQLPRGALLTVAWANPGDAEVAFALRDAGPQGVVDADAIAASACVADHGVSTGHASYDRAAPGKHALVLRYLRPCTSEAALTVAVSLATPEGTKAYLVQLEPGKERELGTLTVR